MPRKKPTILLTGFGPFPGVPENASWHLVDRMLRPARQSLSGYRVVGRLLPTDWEEAPVQLVENLIAEEPMLAIHFGVSRSARGFEIETRAVNAKQATADAAGCLPQTACVSIDAPEQLTATWPATHIVSRLRHEGIPVRRSRDAGRYLCNNVLYESLQFARATGWPARVGFVHIPASLADLKIRAKPAQTVSQLDWATAVRGAIRIVETSLAQPAKTANAAAIG